MSRQGGRQAVTIAAVFLLFASLCRAAAMAPLEMGAPADATRMSGSELRPGDRDGGGGGTRDFGGGDVEDGGTWS
jgi:hypothetical protein